jgi:Flp pilus assembly pilin Flp
MLLSWRNLWGRIVSFWREEEGIEMFEYALVLAFIIFPLVTLVPLLIDSLRAYYELSAFTISLPFP